MLYLRAYRSSSTTCGHSINTMLSMIGGVCGGRREYRGCGCRCSRYMSQRSGRSTCAISHVSETLNVYRPPLHHASVTFAKRDSFHASHYAEDDSKLTFVPQFHEEMPARINLPPFTRALLLILISLSSLNAALRFRKWSATLTARPSATDAANYLSGRQWAIPYLVLLPTSAYKFPWTFLTAAFVENNLVSLTISGLVIWFGGRYLERAWGGKEFAKFLLFVAMIPNIFAFLAYVVWYMMTSTPT